MDYRAAADAEKNFLTETYRLFHRFPEPSRHEFETHARIRRMLDDMNIAHQDPEGNITIALLGPEGGKTVAFRADTDALQQTERTGLDYASEKPGLMHACGHDAHITCGLGLAKLLKAREESLPGRVKIIFQPAEEGELGAQAVLATGLAQADAYFGVHVWSPYNAGELHVSPGGVAASCDMFTLTIRGRGGHGAMPEECVDAIVCASALVGQLQTIVSRFTSPMDPVVVTIGSFHAGTRCNIIAGEAVLEGTIRTFSPETYDRVHAQLDRMIRSCCEGYGCAWEMDMRPACKVVWNDAKLTEMARRAAKRVSPDGALPDAPCALGDDFADYRALGPICYARVGVRNETMGACHPHHSDQFRIDESALPAAVAWMAAMADEFFA